MFQSNYSLLLPTYLSFSFYSCSSGSFHRCNQDCVSMNLVSVWRILGPSKSGGIIPGGGSSVISVYVRVHYQYISLIITVLIHLSLRLIQNTLSFSYLKNYISNSKFQTMKYNFFREIVCHRFSIQLLLESMIDKLNYRKFGKAWLVIEFPVWYSISGVILILVKWS